MDLCTRLDIDNSLGEVKKLISECVPKAVLPNLIRKMDDTEKECEERCQGVREAVESAMAKAILNLSTKGRGSAGSPRYIG